MASRKKLFAVGAIAASALLVSACSGEPEEAPAEETAVEETTAAPEETQEEQAESNGDVTAPGTTLAIGDTAVVEHPVDGEDGVTGLLSATVNSIDAGSVDDLAELDLGESADGLVPFYIQISVAGVDETSDALEGSLLTNAFGGLADGTPAQGLNIIGSFDVCDTDALEEWGADASRDICIISLAPEGTQVDSVQYTPRDENYRADPVIWE